MNRPRNICAALVAALLIVGLQSEIRATTDGNRGAVTRLRPSGGDDTTQLQTALDTCVDDAGPCRIELSAGVFHTDVLLVHKFNGRLTGKGPGRTIIRPLDGQPLRSTFHVFLNRPTLAEPYPILLHFADGGDITLEGFTLDFPSTMTVSPWTLDPANAESQTRVLLSALMVDGAGTDRARFAMSHVDITGRVLPDLAPFGSNVMNAIRFEGQLAFDGTETGTATALGRGQFVAHGVRIRGCGLGFALRDATNLEVLIAGNDVRRATFIGVFLADLGNSRVTVSANRIASDVLGLWWLRGVRPSDAPSEFHAVGNILEINKDNASLLGPGDGVVIQDDTGGNDFIGGAIDRVVVEYNRISLLGEALDAVFVYGDRGKATIAHNQFLGPATDAVVSVDESRGTRILRNDYSDGGATPDVWLLPATTGVRVREAEGTDVLDEGIGNIVVLRR